MGKQIAFYMTYADEQSFIAELRAHGDVVVSLNYFPKPDLRVLDTLPPAGPRIGNNTNLSIYNNDIDPKVIVRKFSTREAYALDFSRSEVIQFNRCFIRTDGELEPGRLWYDHETMQCKPKRKAFLVWAESVLQHIKKNYRYSNNHRRYFGPRCLDAIRNGADCSSPY